MTTRHKGSWRGLMLRWLTWQAALRPAHRAHFRAANAKTPAGWAGVLGLGSLTITYFHTGIRTIIGVESFHGPVRDGKGWDRLAMVIRQRGMSRCFAARPIGKKQ